MSVEVHIESVGETHLVGSLHTAAHSPAVSFAYAPEWLARPGAFAIDPTSLPLRSGPYHSPSLAGAIQDCGPYRWGRVLIERAARKQILDRKPYQDIEDQGEPSVAAALRVAPRFGLRAEEGKAILGEVVAAISGWRQIGKQLRLRASTLDAYATAFEHPLMEEAVRL